MGFTNPIIGGADVLVREAIRSPNFVTGVSGWSINRDGSAEFNDAIFRGDVHVIDANGSRVDIEPGPSLGAAILLTPETLAGITWDAGNIRADHLPAILDNQPGISLTSPRMTGAGARSEFFLFGPTDAGHGSRPRYANLTTDRFEIETTQIDFSVSPFNVVEDGASALLNLALAAAAVPGISIALTIAGPNNAKVHVCGHADAEVLVTNSGVTAVGELLVDGVVQTKQILMNCAIPVSSRFTVGQCWDLSLATGNHTLTMQGRNTGVGAFARFNATHTNLVATVIDC